MRKSTIASRYVFFAAFGAVILYLFMGTGLHADDYQVIGGWRDWADFLNVDPRTKGLMIFGLPTYYTFWWAYFVLGFQHQWVYDLIKGVAHLVSLVCVYKFARDYFSRDRAMIASALFVFYPLYDTTMYWYMTVSAVLTPAVIMYAHSLIRNERTRLGLLFLTLGAFAGYGSPPYVFGLAAIFLFERNYKKAALFAFPGVLYVALYFYIKLAYSGVEARINSHLGIAGIVKSLIMQPITLLEASIGPSYWLKIYYAIGSISLISFILASGIIIYLLIKSDSFSKPSKAPKSLYFGLLCVLFFSFGIYSLTLLYHYSVFNTANRANVYGSLLIAFLLVLLPLNRKTILLLALIFILPVFGLSDHWKSWNSNQKKIIENIENNRQLHEIEPKSTLLVTGNSYSKLGPFSHIDFFITSGLIQSIFKKSVNSNDIVAFTSYLYIDKGFLVDPKFDIKYPLTHKVYIYDSIQNSVNEIPLSSLPLLLSQRPKEIQHWVQLAKGTWIESGIIALSPRLVYLFR